MRLLTLLFAIILSALTANATPHRDPVLVIGASFGNGSVNFTEGMNSPLYGIAVNGGRYLSLGAAIERVSFLPGYVVNEAQAGATTFERAGATAYWESYQMQLYRALARVTAPDGTVGAKFVVITIPNDCLHSAASSSPCTTAELDGVVERLADVGKDALYYGLTPIYPKMPAFDSMDLAASAAAFGFAWTIDEAGWNYLRDRRQQRLPAEVSGALVPDIWRGMRPLPDGLHPDPESATKAAIRLGLLVSL